MFTLKVARDGGTKLGENLLSWVLEAEVKCGVGKNPFRWKDICHNRVEKRVEVPG